MSQRTSLIFAFLGLAIVFSACGKSTGSRPKPFLSTSTAAAPLAPPILPTVTAARLLSTPTNGLDAAPARVPTWSGSALIDSAHGIVFQNKAQVDQPTEIYGSATILNTDTRWVIDAQVNPISLISGDAATGIVLQGLDDKGSVRKCFLVYHLGTWAIGLTRADSDNQFFYWQNFTNLTSPAQHFVLFISGDGQRLGLNNDQGFAFDWSMPDKLFASSQFVTTQAQIGPETQLTVSRLAIQQFRLVPVPDTARDQRLAGSPAPTVLTPDGQAGYVFHVAVSGQDDNPGTMDRPFATLQHARDVVRRLLPDMHGPVIVYLHSGVYFVGQAIRFGPEDSGQNGFEVIYRAAAGETPVLSGGLAVGGWQTVPGAQIWTTRLTNVTDFRQLYVDGVRAQRAASPTPVTGLNWARGNTSDRDGIVMAGNQLPSFSRAQDLELHWIYDWKDMRLPVQSIQDNADGTKTIWMRQPYFSYALSMAQTAAAGPNWYPKYDVPFYLENAVELLNQPGQWYFNPDTQDLYYWPRPGEDLSRAQVTIPQTEQLLTIAGQQAGQEVHNLEFDGLTFAYAGWTRASQVGTFGWQAQALVNIPGGGPHSLVMTPAHVQVTYAHDIRFVRCRFEHLGAVALSLGHGAFNDTVQGNLFHDISDSALVVGHWDDAYITAPAVQVAPHDDLIADNLIQAVGVEYWGAPGISAYYVADISIVHNEIADIPYTGISLGWGWSSTPDSTTSYGNRVTSNLITNLNLRARDGGGIYTLGPQPDTIIEGNFIRNVVQDFACLYPDQGSAYISFRDNVCDNAPRWLHVWTASIHDIQVTNSYTNAPLFLNAGTNVDIHNTISVAGQSWPAQAQIIIQQAGLDSGYSYLPAWLKGE